MIPRTVHGLSAFACLSAMQKCIRRAMEREAMEFACELMHSSKAFHSMVCNRLEVIVHEDIDIEKAPWLVPLVATSVAQAKAWYDPKKIGKSRMAVGNVVRLLSRAPKSREGDHFHAAIGLRNLLEGFAPPIPDWVHDQHTIEGKRKGRGLDYFREHSAVLVPEPESRDEYEDEAYRLWHLKHAIESGRAKDTDDSTEETEQ